MRNALGKINDSVLHALEVMIQLTVKGKNLPSKKISSECDSLCRYYDKYKNDSVNFILISLTGKAQCRVTMVNSPKWALWQNISWCCLVDFKNSQVPIIYILKRISKFLQEIILFKCIFHHLFFMPMTGLNCHVVSTAQVSSITIDSNQKKRSRNIFDCLILLSWATPLTTIWSGRLN